MVLCGNICSSGFYSDYFHVQGCKVAREKKKGLLQTNSLIQSVCRSDLELILFFLFSKIEKNKKNNHRSAVLLLVIFTISVELRNVYRGILSLGMNGP